VAQVVVRAGVRARAANVCARNAAIECHTNEECPVRSDNAPSAALTWPEAEDQSLELRRLYYARRRQNRTHGRRSEDRTSRRILCRL
jgi:hypothetical protein